MNPAAQCVILSDPPRPPDTNPDDNPVRRPLLHDTPARGWLNDPNGLIRHRGRHHLFFQHDPDGNQQRSYDHMHWGHASSTDLMTWREHPPALVPGTPNSPYDRFGCYSGVLVPDGATSVAVYTGNDGHRQQSCIATAVDDESTSFVKHRRNPVIMPPARPVTEFRDHAVTGSAGGWRQLVAGATLADTGAEVGALFRYTSTYPVCGTDRGPYLTSATAPLPGRVWECPDMDDTSVLIVSVIEEPTGGSWQRSVWWMTGIDYGHTMDPTGYGLLDLGDRFYAPQPYWTDDGRRMMFGWITLHLDPRAPSGPWMGAISLPREVRVDAGGLQQRPAGELRRARRAPVERISTTASGTLLTWPNHPGAVEITMPGGAAVEAVELRHDPSGRSHLVDLTTLTGQEPELRHLFFDVGIIEIFTSEGVLTTSAMELTGVSRILLHHRPGSAVGGASARPWLIHPTADQSVDDPPSRSRAGTHETRHEDLLE